MTLLEYDSLSASLQKQIHALLEQQGLGVLSTKDQNGHPYASLVAYATNTGFTKLYFVTPMATRKFDNITSDPRVAILINNSINTPADFHDAMAVTVLGNARLLEGGDKDKVLPNYLEKHPYLQNFAHSPSCALFAIEITGFTMVQQFQSVSELKLTDATDSHS